MSGREWKPDVAVFERMKDILADEFDWFGMEEDNTVESLSAAFTKALNPPKPEEPTGLGAVVEDADGERWVRSHTASEAQWTRPHLSGTYFYRQIAAIRVLSEGVADDA